MGKVVDILKKVNAVITDSHIVLTSGRHSDAYINPDALLPHPLEVTEIAELFAQKFQHEEIDVVVGPAIGGIVLSTWVAYHLTKLKGKEVLGLFTEKTVDNNQVVERGFDKFIKGKKVLIVEDITATGGSVKKVVDRIRETGGEVAAVSVIVNRDIKNVTETVVGAPFSWLDEIAIESFEEKDCPMCKAKKPINTTVGHGKEYLEEKVKK